MLCKTVFFHSYGSDVKKSAKMVVVITFKLSFENASEQNLYICILSFV